MAKTQQLKTPVYYYPFFDDGEVEVKQKNRKSTILASTLEANNSKKISTKLRIDDYLTVSPTHRLK